VHHPDRDVADVKDVPVGEGLERKLGLGDRVHGHWEAVLERQATVARHVVGMRMRLEDADDPHTFLRGRRHVLLDRVRGVDDQCLAAGGIPDQVRGAAEIVVDELAEQHDEEANTVAR
jgi:hypothetical protein